MNELARRRVLVIEDEPRYVRLLTLNFEGEGAVVRAAGSAAEARAVLAEWSPDLIILDLGLPDEDGLALCQQLRGQSSAPIVIVTARGATPDRVRGLDLGADDYVTKPFAPEELLARARAVWRRVSSPAAPSRFESGELVVDLASGQVTLAGNPLALTPTEYRLLELFVQHAGQLLTPEEILRRVWGPAYEGASYLVRLYVSRLRAKLGRAAPWIETKPGIGYRWRSECPLPRRSGETLSDGGAI
ncbi:MAG: DNA-binding response regulator [Dehalococcoidia bacterium]|nr:MAG: DNA-binding response regulator [Dehalococcoidia bacterium]